MDWEALIWSTPFPATRKLVMLAIARQADATGFAQISSLQLAAITGMTDRSVRDQVALAEASGHLQRFPRIGFRISLTRPDSTTGTSFRKPYLDRNHVPQLPEPRSANGHGISSPLILPSPDLGSLTLGSPSCNSGSISSPEVLENEQLSLVPVTETPTWLVNLRSTPGYDLDRRQESKLVARVAAAGFPTPRLVETAAIIAAKWDSVKFSPKNRHGYKRIDLTFYAWASREGNGAKPWQRVSVIEQGQKGAFADASRYHD